MPGLGVMDTIQFEGVEYRRYNRAGKRQYGGKYYRHPCEKWEGRPWSLHVAIWEWSRGLKMPTGYCIHHIDEESGRNSPKNLHCMSIIAHNRWHTWVRAMAREARIGQRSLCFN
ncbi:hypothetical protein KAR91_66895 [Candidatus Pacearchaeota archaeon]|nr:hypothetical protein [Candidatus Pacearchaeota archaeon]